MEIKLTKEETKFMEERRREYLKPDYNKNYRATKDRRTRLTWAKNKAFDDAINMEEVKEALSEE